MIPDLTFWVICSVFLLTGIAVGIGCTLVLLAEREEESYRGYVDPIWSDFERAGDELFEGL